ncbi:MAG: lytic transglycosylase domain-containing protein [Bryobacteraceae bacterium]|nr:lytic transglycosylase domain-containing protein [Bryobacteraceae bacterium]
MRRAMESSISKQKASIAVQAASVKASPDGWFTTRWLTEADMVDEVSQGCERIPPAQLQAYIEDTARREGFTPDLLRAVISRESDFQPCAVSPKGAQGLMQLMPGTAADLGVQDPFDPKENISAGARFLGLMLDRYAGNIGLALAAYNAGPGRVDTYGGLPPIPETRNYVADIMDKLKVEPLPSPRTF